VGSDERGVDDVKEFVNDVVDLFAVIGVDGDSDVVGRPVVRIVLDVSCALIADCLED
jgi:hypothetical protein